MNLLNLDVPQNVFLQYSSLNKEKYEIFINQSKRIEKTLEIQGISVSPLGILFDKIQDYYIYRINFQSDNIAYIQSTLDLLLKAYSDSSEEVLDSNIGKEIKKLFISRIDENSSFNLQKQFFENCKELKDITLEFQKRNKLESSTDDTGDEISESDSKDILSDIPNEFLELQKIFPYKELYILNSIFFTTLTLTERHILDMTETNIEYEIPQNTEICNDAIINFVLNKDLISEEYTLRLVYNETKNILGPDCVRLKTNNKLYNSDYNEYHSLGEGTNKNLYIYTNNMSNDNFTVLPLNSKFITDIVSKNIKPVSQYSQLLELRNKINLIESNLVYNNKIKSPKYEKIQKNFGPFLFIKKSIDNEDSNESQIQENNLSNNIGFSWHKDYLPTVFNSIPVVYRKALPIEFLDSTPNGYYFTNSQEIDSTDEVFTLQNIKSVDSTIKEHKLQAYINFFLGKKNIPKLNNTDCISDISIGSKLLSSNGCRNLLWKKEGVNLLTQSIKKKSIFYDELKLLKNGENSILSDTKCIEESDQETIIQEWLSTANLDILPPYLVSHIELELDSCSPEEIYRKQKTSVYNYSILWNKKELPQFFINLIHVIYKSFENIDTSLLTSSDIIQYNKYISYFRQYNCIEIQKDMICDKSSDVAMICIITGILNSNKDLNGKTYQEWIIYFERASKLINISDWKPIMKYLMYYPEYWFHISEFLNQGNIIMAILYCLEKNPRQALKLINLLKNYSLESPFSKQLVNIYKTYWSLRIPCFAEIFLTLVFILNDINNIKLAPSSMPTSYDIIEACTEQNSDSILALCYPGSHLHTLVIFPTLKVVYNEIQIYLPAIVIDPKAIRRNELLRNFLIDCSTSAEGNLGQMLNRFALETLYLCHSPGVPDINDLEENIQSDDVSYSQDRIDDTTKEENHINEQSSSINTNDILNESNKNITTWFECLSPKGKEIYDFISLEIRGEHELDIPLLPKPLIVERVHNELLDIAENDDLTVLHKELEESEVQEKAVIVSSLGNSAISVFLENSPNLINIYAQNHPILNNNIWEEKKKNILELFNSSS